MYTKWTQHLKTPEEKKRFEASVVGARHVFDRLLTIIDDGLIELEKSEINDSFESAAWPYKQAFKNGAKSELKALRRLINLDEQVIKIDDKQ